MTPPITMEPSAADLMQPLPATIALGAKSATARAEMKKQDLSFLVVVAPDTEKLLGVVLRGALERACESNGHEPDCPIAQHLKTGIDFCFIEERVAEAVGGEPDLSSMETRAARKARLRRSLPVIVVDEQKVPVGYLAR